jgi:hypothetical protein
LKLLLLQLSFKLSLSATELFVFRLGAFELGFGSVEALSAASMTLSFHFSRWARFLPLRGRYAPAQSQRNGQTTCDKKPWNAGVSAKNGADIHGSLPLVVWCEWLRSGILIDGTTKLVQFDSSPMDHVQMLGERESIYIGDLNEAKRLLMPVGSHRSRYGRDGSTTLRETDFQANIERSRFRAHLSPLIENNSRSRKFHSSNLSSTKAIWRRNSEIRTSSQSISSFHLSTSRVEWNLRITSIWAANYLHTLSYMWSFVRTQQVLNGETYLKMLFSLYLLDSLHEVFSSP